MRNGWATQFPSASNEPTNHGLNMKKQHLRKVWLMLAAAAAAATASQATYSQQIFNKIKMQSFEQTKNEKLSLS